MGRRLFIGNLSHDTTELGLQTLFGNSGTVAEAQIVVDRFTGLSRGFGFVEMSSDGEAQKAIEQLHGCDVDGRAITVNAAQERLGGRR